MNKVARLLSWRYLCGSTYEKNISTMVIISFVGILIGSFSLALVTAVMNGFESTIHEKMQGIHAHIIIRGYGDPLNVDAIGSILRKHFPEIAAFSPSNIEHTIVRTQQAESPPTVAMIKGVDPVQEALVSNIAQKIVTKKDDHDSFADLLVGNHILIGYKLAQDLDATVGDNVQLLHTDFEQTKARKITLDATDTIVGGIFNTGIDEFDSGLIMCSLDFLQNIFPESGTTQLNIKLKPGVNEQAVVEKLTEKLKLEVYSWKDLYPALVSALILEKYVMFLILALITLVASMSILSLLYMQITQKRPDIAILRAIGTPHATITTIFMTIGMLITCSASIVGIALACATSFFLETFPFITLPDAYYVTHLPAKMEWYLALIVFAVVMIMSFIAIWIPTRKIKSINVADVLRFEG